MNLIHYKLVRFEITYWKLIDDIDATKCKLMMM